MKKLLALLSFLVLFTAITCEDEPLDDEVLENLQNAECEQAVIATGNAALEFLNATEDNYNAICIAYKEALENQITACGDDDGTLQAAINALEDCTNDGFSTDDCEEARELADGAAAALEEATSDNYEELCNAYKSALENQIEACGDSDGSLQATIDALEDCTNDGVSTDDCEEARELADGAAAALEEATSDNYEELCNAYKFALENQIEACGDDGTLQIAISDLGDCIPASGEGGITFNAGSAPFNFDLIDVVVEGDILKVTAKTSANGASNYEMYFEVAQGQAGVDIINDTFYLTLTSTLYPDTSGFNDFTSDITENSTGVLIGTFGGIVRNDDNGVLELTSGNINITY